MKAAALIRVAAFEFHLRPRQDREAKAFLQQLLPLLEKPMCALKAPVRGAWIHLRFLAIVIFAGLPLRVWGASPTVFLSQIRASTSLPNGIELRDGKMLMRI